MPSLTDVPGFLVGQAENREAATGLTVALCPEPGAVGGLAVCGAASSTRQVGALTAGHVVEKVHAILFTGGSSFGLEAAGGVMAYLEERGVGFDVGVTRIPIVPAAAIFDLRLGDPRLRPDAAMARRACQAAGPGPVAQGSVGAGCGATVGKFHGLEQAMKGGLGSSSLRGPEGVVVGGLVVVNAFGDVHDPATGRIIAGARVAPGSSRFADAEALLLSGQVRPPQPFRNTTLALVATNARLDRQACLRLAEMASQGLARIIRPFGTMFDGDLVIALSAGEVQADLHVLGLLAQRALMTAVVNAVTQADGLGLLPAVRDLGPRPCPP